MTDNEFTKIAVRWPVTYSLIVGAVVGIVGAAGFGPWAGISGGLAFAAITWFFWRPGGPGTNRERRRGLSDDRVNWRKVWLTLPVGIAVSIPPFLWIWLTADR